MQLLSRRKHAPRAPEKLPTSPRQVAIGLLAEKIQAGAAGLDQYDLTVFILDATENERVWVYRALELCGCVINRDPRSGGGYRFRAILEANVRIDLGLDGEQPPLMDEPLASRSITATHGEVLMDATLAALPYAPTRLHPAHEESEGMLALRQAKAAYDRKGAA